MERKEFIPNSLAIGKVNTYKQAETKNQFYIDDKGELMLSIIDVCVIGMLIFLSFHQYVLTYFTAHDANIMASISDSSKQNVNQ